MKKCKFQDLRGLIIAKFGTLYAFAEAMGWSRVTLTNKISGKRDWKRNEILKAAKLLEIPDDRIAEYFNV